MALFEHPVVTGLLIVGALTYFISRLSKIGSRDPHLPPGPPTHPIIGNLAILPPQNAYLTYMRWAKIYGDIFSLKVGTQTLIIISSYEAANEILEKNSDITSDRPPFELFRRFAPSGMVAFTPYGPLWKRMRKAVTEVMKPAARRENRPILLAEISQMLLDIHEDAENMFYHIQRASASAMFSITGGVRVPLSSSPLHKKFFHLHHTLSEVCQPGYALPVDIIPILNYIPDRFARNWKSRCASIRQMLEEIVHVMADGVEQRLREGRQVGCHLELMFQAKEDWLLDRQSLLDITAGLVLGGAITTASHLHWIVLLAAAHPAVQQKLQEELDQVVGDERSPTIEDIPHLPYLNAFIKEAHRFRPISPLQLPRRAREDLWYQGKLIPKGSQIFFNAWDVYHNPKYYDDPNSFDPDRFIRSPFGTRLGLDNQPIIEAMKKADMIPFGWGKRRCPGMPMGMETGSLAAANLFWAFDF
ncbi:hypothetical protein FRC02_002794, partial [Tulasnella sp. 418]